MAAYAAIAEVEALIPWVRLDVNTTPTKAQATAWLSDVAAEMDTALAARDVLVPVTAPAYFLEYIQQLNAIGVAALVLQAAAPDSDDPGGFAKRYADALHDWKMGRGIPSAAAEAGTAVYPATYFTANPAEEATLGDLAGASRFKMAREF